MKWTHWRSTRFWLRAASMLSLVLAAGHTAGGMKSWSPTGETEVLRAMRDFKVQVQGAERSYLDFYLGFGWSLSVYLLLQAVLLWQVATLNAASPAGARALIATFVVANALAAVVAGQFIFATPTACFAAITGCLLMAWAVHGASRGTRAA